MKKSKMSATALRRTLGTAIILLILLAGVGFYFAQNWLSTFAVSVSHTVADSKSSGTGLKSLQKLQQELASRQNIITKTDSMFASTSTYQAQAVQDLITYAAQSGLTISDYTFPTTTTSAATASIPTTQVTVTLTSPVSYIGLLKFMTAIESNLPKMQITSINVGRISGDSTSVKIDQLTVAVYTR